MLEEGAKEKKKKQQNAEESKVLDRIVGVRVSFVSHLLGHTREIAFVGFDFFQDCKEKILMRGSVPATGGLSSSRLGRHDGG